MNYHFHKRRLTKKREPTITLINIVFLMLIFFLVTGTVGRNIPKGIHLPDVASLEQTTLPNALVLYPDGDIRFHGQPLKDVELWRQAQDTQIIHILPDRDSKAFDLLDLAAKLKTTPQTQVSIITERKR